MTAEDTTTLTSARLDLWLWSVRIFKTRSLAADECKGGHVRVNDAPAKPSQKLKKGDEERERSALEAWVASLPAPYSVELKTLYAEMDALETDEARL